MELETLKTLWQEQDTPLETETSREELLALLQKQSGGPIARMRRSLRKEVIIMILSYLPCILYYRLAFNGQMSSVAWVFVVTIAFFYVYYYRKNKLLKKMQCVSCEVRSNLAGQLRTLQKYLRFYFWSSTIATPVVIVLAFVIATRDLHEASFAWGRRIWLLLGLVVICTFAVFFVSRWSIRLLYGRHVKKLQDLLDEMDEI
jgi:hypothetical protein